MCLGPMKIWPEGAKLMPRAQPNSQTNRYHPKYTQYPLKYRERIHFSFLDLLEQPTYI